MLQNNIRISLNCADYLSSGQEYRKNTTWYSRFFIDECLINEQSSLGIESRLGGDLGLYAYTSDTRIAVGLLPSFRWAYGSNIYLALKFQLGDRFVASLSCTKAYPFATFQLATSFIDSRLSYSFSISRNILNDISTKLEFREDQNRSGSLSITKNYGEHKKLSLITSSTTDGCEIIIGGSYQIMKPIVFHCSETIILKDITGDTKAGQESEIGFSLKLDNKVSVGYYLQAKAGKIALVTKLKKDRFILRLPLTVANIASFKNLVFCGLAILSASAFTYLLYKTKTGLKNKSTVINSKRFKQQEKMRDHEDYLYFIRDSVNLMRVGELQKNGLIILKASYGNVLKGLNEKKNDVIDVTDILQKLVIDSKLYLPQGSKETYIGFFNPCPKKMPLLYIKYQIADIVIEKIIKDADLLLLP